MPFDWSEKQMSHVNVVHVETHFPKDFVEKENTIIEELNFTLNNWDS